MKFLRGIGHGLLALLLVTSVAGLTTREHFCMGKSVSFSLLPAGHDCQPMPEVCEGDQKKPVERPDDDVFYALCCDDIYHFQQVDLGFKATSLSWCPSNLQAVAPTYVVQPIVAISEDLLFPFSHSPPALAPNERLIRHQVFRI